MLFEDVSSEGWPRVSPSIELGNWHVHTLGVLQWPSGQGWVSNERRKGAEVTEALGHLTLESGGVFPSNRGVSAYESEVL